MRMPAVSEMTWEPEPEPTVPGPREFSAMAQRLVSWAEEDPIDLAGAALETMARADAYRLCAQVALIAHGRQEKRIRTLEAQIDRMRDVIRAYIHPPKPKHADAR